MTDEMNQEIPDAADPELPSKDHGPSEPTPVVFIIGAGVVGTTLARALAKAGVPVAGVHGRQTDLSDSASAAAGVLGSSGEFPESSRAADVVIISVRDTRIPEIAKRLVTEKRLRPEQVVLHTSGSSPASEMLSTLRPHVKGIGTLHPLVAVTDAPGALENVSGAYFGLEGDEPALHLATKLVRMMGGRALPVAPKNMALYHTAAVMASNYVVALADIARSLFVGAGVPDEHALPALLPLMNSAVRNMVELGLPAALTGPAVRGDVVAIERHVAALEDKAPEVLDLYRRLGREVLRIARKRAPDLEDRAVEMMASLFDSAAGSEQRHSKERLAPAATKPKKK